MLSKGLGGLEKMACDYHVELGNCGYNSHIILHKDAKILQKYGNFQQLFPINARSQYDIFAALRVLKTIKKHRITHVILHGKRALAMALLAKIFMLRAPVLIYIQHAQFSDKNIAKIDYVACLNSAAQKRLWELNILPTERVVLLPNFINLSRYSYNFKENNELRIGWIGRFDEIKGLDLFLSAISELRGRRGNFSVKIAGGNKDRALSFTKSDLGGVDFLGWVEDVRHFLQNIDLLCITSRSETFCLTMLEAMASGVLVISTPCNGPCEISARVKNSAIIAEDFTIGAIVNSLEFALNLPKEQREEIVKNGHKVAESYDISHWISDFDSLLRQCTPPKAS